VESHLFTGIIEEVGTIEMVHSVNLGGLLTIRAGAVLPGMKAGDSIAVNGVCLTVVRFGPTSFSCDLSAETLERTGFGKAHTGQLVNLERPLSVGARLGGHFVQGHVDALGRLAFSSPSGAGTVIGIEHPRDLDRYLVQKGSIAVDGISLTIASIEKDFFTVAVIPHTLQNTNLKSIRIGDSVNLEADILGKHIERLLRFGSHSGANSSWDLQYLKEQGF
jgi:riboflavin synthase